MLDAGTGAEPLRGAGLDDAAVPGRVLVRECAVENPGDDLDVGVMVQVISRARQQRLLVDRDDRPERDVVGVVVRAVTERVPRRDVAGLGDETVGGALHVHQAYPSSCRRASSMPKWWAISWTTVMRTSSMTSASVSQMANVGLRNTTMRSGSWPP